jgi:hypothetical protein
LLHLLWIVPLLLLIFFLASPRFRGDIAETRVRRLLASGLERNLYTVFNDVVLPSGGGTVQIDHLVVSRFGIFVIESCYVRGWISGTAVQERWRQHHTWRSVRFPNPLHRNQLQVDALQRLLDFPTAAFHPLVVLVGHKGFKKRPPEGVVSPESLLAQIRKQSRPLLSAEQANDVLHKVEQVRLKPGGERMFRPLSVLRLLLFLGLLMGAWLAFRDDLARLTADLQQRAEQRSAPEQYHPDGRRKSEREIWEDSLVCAYSQDTGRCSCYDPGGARAAIAPADCKALAERGSVLER